MTRDNISDSAESEPDTDTDDEYDTGVTAYNPGLIRNVDKLYREQRGMCRITNIPFSEGLYSPAVVARCLRKPISDTNAMLVLKIIDDMHSSRPEMPWRTFCNLMHILGERAEI